MPQSVGFNAETAYWPAVFSLFAGVTSLISAEFMPVSLLIPIARDMGITEGMAGQSVTVVGTLAVLSSLLLAPLTRSIDRRRVLLTLSALVVVSNCLVALAPNYPAMLLGRAILGICTGGFWSMASAVTMYLVPTKDIPRGLSIVYAGVSVATILSLPLASFLGHLVGWRNVFLFAALMGAGAFAWQYLTLPSIPPRAGNDFKSMFGLFKKDWMLTAIGARILNFGGYHVFFTYLRPFFELDLHLSPTTLSGVLLAFGIANCLGTVAAGMLLGKHFGKIIRSVPVVLAVAAAILYITNGMLTAGIVLAIGWGFTFGFLPVAWSTWITRTMPDNAEIGGGISVAAIQFSIGFAAAVGGFTFDNLGTGGIFIIAAAFQIAAALLIRVSLAMFTKETGKPL